jgi:hypothetical protein
LARVAAKFTNQTLPSFRSTGAWRGQAMTTLDARTRSGQKDDTALVAAVVRASITSAALDEDVRVLPDPRRTALQPSLTSVINMTDPEAGMAEAPAVAGSARRDAEPARVQNEDAPANDAGEVASEDPPQYRQFQAEDFEQIRYTMTQMRRSELEAIGAVFTVAATIRQAGVPKAVRAAPAPEDGRRNAGPDEVVNGNAPANDDEEVARGNPPPYPRSYEDASDRSAPRLQPVNMADPLVIADVARLEKELDVARAAKAAESARRYVELDVVEDGNAPSGNIEEVARGNLPQCLRSPDAVDDRDRHFDTEIEALRYAVGSNHEYWAREEDEWDKQRKELYVECEELKQALNTSKRKFAAQDKDLDAICADYDELQVKLGACKKKLEARNESLGGLRKKMTFLKDFSEQRRKTMAGVNAHLTREINKYRQASADMTAAFDHAAYENDRLNRENEELHTDNATLENAALRKTGQVDALRKENSRLHIAYLGLKTKMQRRDQIQAKQREIDDLERELRDLTQVEKNRTNKRRRLQ